MGKETVKFRLDGALQPGQQKNHNCREVKDVVVRYEMCIEANRLKKLSVKQILGKPEKNYAVQIRLINNSAQACYARQMVSRLKCQPRIRSC
jgi:hypothetical protein